MNPLSGEPVVQRQAEAVQAIALRMVAESVWERDEALFSQIEREYRPQEGAAREVATGEWGTLQAACIEWLRERGKFFKYATRDPSEEFHSFLHWLESCDVWQLIYVLGLCREKGERREWMSDAQHEILVRLSREKQSSALLSLLYVEWLAASLDAINRVSGQLTKKRQLSILVDTNVVLDLVISRRRDSRLARHTWQVVDEARKELCTSEKEIHVYVTTATMAEVT